MANVALILVRYFTVTGISVKYKFVCNKFYCITEPFELKREVYATTLLLKQKIANLSLVNYSIEFITYRHLEIENPRSAFNKKINMC